jgi:hypothetical protein
MSGPKDRLTRQQEQFVRLVVEEDASFVAAYRLAYPPRNGQRSPVAERVAARRVAHNPVIERRMDELRDQLRAGDPVELRRRANAVLGRILGGQLDPKFRRVAMDTLIYLDRQELAAEKSERESLRTALALLDGIEDRGGRRHSRARRRASEMSQERAEPDAGWQHSAVQSHRIAETDADSERRRAEIDEVIAERRRMRLGS